jgi:hypothetical protein
MACRWIRDNDLSEPDEQRLLNAALNWVGRESQGVNRNLNEESEKEWSLDLGELYNRVIMAGRPYSSWSPPSLQSLMWTSKMRMNVIRMGSASISCFKTEDRSFITTVMPLLFVQRREIWENI